MADNPPSNWNKWQWRPDLTEPELHFQTRPGSFIDKFFSLSCSVNRQDSETEEYLRYGSKYFKIIGKDDNTDTMDS